MDRSACSTKVSQISSVIQLQHPHLHCAQLGVVMLYNGRHRLLRLRHLTALALQRLPPHQPPCLRPIHMSNTHARHNDQLCNKHVTATLSNPLPFTSSSPLPPEFSSPARGPPPPPPPPTSWTEKREVKSESERAGAAEDDADDDEVVEEEEAMRMMSAQRASSMPEGRGGGGGGV